MISLFQGGKKRQGLLGRRILWRSFWSILLVTGLVMSLQTLIVVHQKREQRLRTVTETIEILMPNLASAAWQVSESNIKTLLSSLVALEGANAARFRDGYLDVETTSLRAEVPADVWGHCQRLIHRSLVGFPVGEQRLPAGEMEVCFEQPDSLASLAPGSLIAALPLLMLVLLAPLFPALLVRRMVIKPIEELIQAIRNSHGNQLLHFSTTRPDLDRGDEIDLLVDEVKERTRRFLQEQDIVNLAFKSLGHGIAVTDAQHTVVRANREFAHLLGLEQEGVVGHSMAKTLEPSVLNESRAMVELETQKGRFLEVSGADIHTGSEDAHRVYMVRDLTEKKLLESQMQQSQKMNALGTLSSGVAHDFNNLLMAIGGNAALIAETESLSDDGREMLQAIRGAAKKGASLTSQLLSFARKQQLKMRTVSVGTVVGELVALSKRTLGTAHLLVVEQDGEVAVVTDPVFLETAILNLLVNARDAQPAGGTIRIVVGQSVDDKARPMVDISVINAGPTIPPEVLARMGEPFFSTKAVGKGTGLGLPMVAGFAQQSGGSLLIASAEGETCITIRLPEAEPKSASAPEAIPETVSAGRCGATGAVPATTVQSLLLVDDDLPVRTTLQRMLKSIGFRVSQASSLQEVQRLWAKGERWDGVLCDVMLEGHSGLEVYDYLMQVGMPPRFCFISGNVPDALMARIEQLGTVGLLAKPLDMDELQEHFRQG